MAVTVESITAILQKQVTEAVHLENNKRRSRLEKACELLENKDPEVLSESEKVGKNK